MSEVRLRGAEIDCVKKLAAMFESGQDTVDCRQGDPLGLPPAQRKQILQTMQDFGVIKDTIRTHRDEEFAYFTISSQVVQAARQIEEQEEARMKVNLVEEMKLTIHRNRYIAWPLMVILALVFAATAVNQIVGALKAVGIVK